MRIYTFPLVLLLFVLSPSYGQNIVLENGFGELQLGITQSRVSEIVGFEGRELTKQGYIDTQLNGRDRPALPAFRTGFDLCILYNHIMPIPVTEIFLTDDRVSAIVISSFPSFTRPLCLDTRTAEGLTFWSSRNRMEQLYGKDYRLDKPGDGDLTWYYYDSRGIGFGLTNNEVRIISYYRH